jgi:hypothetical protein
MTGSYRPRAQGFASADPASVERTIGRWGTAIAPSSQSPFHRHKAGGEGSA